MTDEDLKKITKVVKLEINDALDNVNKKLDDNGNQFMSITSKLDEHSIKLDSLMLDMVDVQKKTDVLPDLHSMIKDTKEKVDELQERVDRLETAV